MQLKTKMDIIAEKIRLIDLSLDKVDRQIRADSIKKGIEMRLKTKKSLLQHAKSVYELAKREFFSDDEDQKV